MKVKKVVGAVLALALVATSGSMLAGCRKKHTHEYSSQVCYGVENGVAYTYNSCGCGEIKNKQNLTADSYIVVNPTTAQSVLDSNINNKTIVFDSGIYNTQLELRATRETVNTIYNYRGTETIQLNDLDSSTEVGFRSFREIKNGKFVAVENAEFREEFVCESTYTTVASESAYRYHDYVRNVPSGVDGSKEYFTHIDLLNCEFHNFNFTGKDGRFTFKWSNNDTRVDNLTINNCSFITDVGASVRPQHKVAAIRLWSNITAGHTTPDATNRPKYENNLYNNIVITNNTIIGHEGGVYSQNVNGITISNNTVKNMSDSAFSIHKYCTLENPTFTYTNSSILFENNLVENCTDTALHLNANENVTVNVKNNTIKNSGAFVEQENKTYIMIFNNLNESNVTCSNNTLDGNKLSELSNSTESANYICK